MNDKFKQKLAELAAESGLHKVVLSPATIVQVVETAERVAYAEGVTWTLEQIAKGRPAKELLAEAWKLAEGLERDHAAMLELATKPRS